MKLLVVGGKLQGAEACSWPPRQAGRRCWWTAGRRHRGAGLADRHVVADVTADAALTRALVASCDAVLPACEDLATLEWLCAQAPSWDTPLLFDLRGPTASPSPSSLRANSSPASACRWAVPGRPVACRP